MCPSAWDVHRKRSQIAVVDDTGVPQRNRIVPNDPVQLVPILGALPPGTPVAFEAAYGWGWLVELLEELQLEPHLEPHAVLADRGIPEPSSLWTAPGRAWLADLALPPTHGRSFRTAAGCWMPWPPGRPLEGEIAALAKPDPRVQALMALPGIGKLTAMTLVAEIGDISRFPTARKLCA